LDGHHADAGVGLPGSYRRSPGGAARPESWTSIVDGGLSTFVVGHNQAAAAGGWVRLAAPSAWLAQLLDTVGLTRRLNGYPGVAEALAGRDPV
jgi:hypothetical protein